MIEYLINLGSVLSFAIFAALLVDGLLDYDQGRERYYRAAVLIFICILTVYTIVCIS